MSKYVIIHGAFYELTDDELAHFKYIKKERKNGRWVYYYDDDLDNYEQIMNDAKAQRDRYAYEKEKTAAELSAAGKAFMDTLNNIENNGLSLSTLSSQKDAAEKATKANEEANELYEKANDLYEKSVAAYEKEKVSELPQKAIAKGVVAVANFFSKLFGKKKKK